MPSNHIILCCLLLPSVFPSISAFSSESGSLHQGPEYWSFSFNICVPRNIQDWLSLRLTGLISLLSKGFSKVFSSTTVQKLWHSAFFLVQLSYPYMTTGKTIPLTTQTFVRITWRDSVQFSCSVVSNSATSWTAARQASLSITNSLNVFKLMTIMSVMPPNHLILCHPLLLLPSIFPSIRVPSNERVLQMSQFFASGGQSIVVSALASVFSMNIQD